MKIMKVVYSAEKQDIEWSHMGEESWQVGENFNGEFVKGKVTGIYLYESRGVEVQVGKSIAMYIPPHAVQRIYYGEE